MNSGAAARRGPQTLADVQGFTVAALAPEGVAFASDHAGKLHPAVVTFRPFDSGDKSAEWSKPLPAKSNPLGLAVGKQGSGD